MPNRVGISGRAAFRSPARVEWRPWDERAALGRLPTPGTEEEGTRTNGTRQGTAPQGKKGLPVLAWIAIGCGGIVVLGGIAFTLIGWLAVSKMKDVASDFEDNPTRAAAELMVRMNPELEMVESDEDAGTLTVREKSSGKVITFNYEDIKEDVSPSRRTRGRWRSAASRKAVRAS